MNRRQIVGLALITIAILLPIVLAGTRYATYVEHTLVRIMLLGLMAMAWDFLFGFLGMFSFGHAAFFGTGAYVAGILVARADVTSLPLVVLAALFAAVLVGLVVGFLSARVGSVAVFLVTFTCAEAIYLIVLADPMGLTNGDNGLLGVVPKPFLGFDVRNEVAFYYLSLVVLLASWAALHAITRSQFGQVLTGIRENELRVRFAGYSVEQYKTAAFAISAFFSGLAGILTTFHERIAAPEMTGWLYSAEAVLYATLGGIGTLIGPVLGTGIVIVAREILSDYLASWLIFVGVTYIVLIFFLPSGVYSLFFREGQGKAQAPAAEGKSRSLASWMSSLSFRPARHGEN
jgi:branched-chain amino acid transport system permease protein